MSTTFDRNKWARTGPYRTADGRRAHLAMDDTTGATVLVVERFREVLDDVELDARFPRCATCGKRIYSQTDALHATCATR